MVREPSQTSMVTRYTSSHRGSSLSTKRIRMRISDITFREVEVQDLERLLSTEYQPQYYLDAASDELVEIDLHDWRETLKRMCLSPASSLWVQEQPSIDEGEEAKEEIPKAIDGR